MQCDQLERVDEARESVLRHRRQNPPPFCRAVSGNRKVNNYLNIQKIGKSSQQPLQAAFPHAGCALCIPPLVSIPFRCAERRAKMPGTGTKVP